MFRTLLIVLCLTAGAFAEAPATAPSNHRVLIISIDGCRPDVLLRADAPVLHGLMRQGTFTLWAQTTAVAITIPSHVSMLTGAKPDIHGVLANTDLPPEQRQYPLVPTIFEIAQRAGYTTGMVAGKSKFDCFDRPGALSVKWIPSRSLVFDREVRAHALEIIDTAPPDVLFVHFPQNDSIGHHIGWGSPEQVEHLHETDAAIGDILRALRAKGLLDRTLIIVSADHGGAGRTHGPDDSRSRCIPWIVVGPDVRQGVDLSCTDSQRTIHTEDTFATASAFLKLSYDDRNLFGAPVAEIWNRPGEILYVQGKIPQGPRPVDWDSILNPAPHPAGLFAAPSSR